MTAQNEADKLRQEAKDILNGIISKMLNLPKDVEVTGIDRLVDCIIGAAVIEMAVTFENAVKIQEVSDADSIAGIVEA